MNKYAKVLLLTGVLAILGITISRTTHARPSIEQIVQREVELAMGETRAAFMQMKQALITIAQAGTVAQQRIADKIK
jgi:hypothetical protein